MLLESTAEEVSPRTPRRLADGPFLGSKLGTPQESIVKPFKKGMSRWKTAHFACVFTRNRGPRPEISALFARDPFAAAFRGRG